MNKWLVLKASGGGGLGDSIKAVLVAALYAKRTNRILVVDWSGGIYSDGSYNAFEFLFKIKNLSYQSDIPNSLDVFPDVWRNRLGMSLHDVYTEDDFGEWDRVKAIDKYSFNLSRTDYQSEVLVMWEFDQIEKLLSLYDDDADNALSLYQYAAKQFLQLNDELQDQVNIQKGCFPNNMLAIHIRQTNEFKKNKSALSLNAFISTIDRLNKDDFGGIFLATDNAYVQDKIITRYTKVFVTKKWFSKPGESLHLNHDCPDQIKGLREALLDMLLLSVCNTFVVTPNSSFSEVSVIFSSPDTTIINPTNMSLLSKFKRYIHSIIS